MRGGLAGFLLALAWTALTGCPPLASAALGQPPTPSSQADYPTFFKVHSPDGYESLTASCTPVERSPVVDRVTCDVVNVRLIPPDRRQATLTAPLSVEEALKIPQVAAEVKKDPKGFDLEMRRRLEALQREACSGATKEVATFETKLRDPRLGAKWKAYYEEVIAACRHQDPRLFVERLLEVHRRTCRLWLHRYTISFERARPGQWVSRQKAPGLQSRGARVYELTGDGMLWTLSESPALGEGSTEESRPTVWSWRNLAAYGSPCDFISHDVVHTLEP